MVFSAYADLCSSGQIEDGEEVDFAAASGNLNAATAGYYAKKWACRSAKFSCRSIVIKPLSIFHEGFAEYGKDVPQGYGARTGRMRASERGKIIV